MNTKCARLGCSQLKTGTGGFWKKIVIANDVDSDDDEEDDVYVQDFWLCSMHCLAAWKFGNPPPPPPKVTTSTAKTKHTPVPAQIVANETQQNPFSLPISQSDDE